MDKSILEFLMKSMFPSSKNSSPFNQSYSPSNPAINSYPPEAAFNDTAQQANNSNDLLPLLMSMLGKGGNPLADILSQNNKKEEENSSPNNEILL